MARLQILELPEGAGDERPPFVLVIDEWDIDSLDTHAMLTEHWDDFAKKIGARACLFVDRTIDIPANEVALDENGRPLYLKVRVEGEFEQVREQVQDEIRKAQADVTRALREARNLPDSRESTGRPTHPDGTPYNYSEIVAEGWEHCDGCRTWGQWTAGDPHNCPNTYIKGPAVIDTERSPEE